ncbi:MAG: Mu transposase C-terminal domain-containing protein [Nitrospinae bacterium]|nr:Mu transposase C-terminal domain-containing protein [Nitrospinota bacterium]
MKSQINDGIGEKEGCNLLAEGYNQGYNQNGKVTTENQAILTKGYNQNHAQNDDIYLTRKEVEEFLGITLQAVLKGCKEGKYKAIKVNGNGGKQYRIALSSLPPDAQLKWIQKNQETAKLLSEHIKERLSSQAQWEIEKMKVDKGGNCEGQITVCKIDYERMELVQKALSVPQGYKKGKWKRKCAVEAGITYQTLCGDIKGYKEQGSQYFNKERKQKGTTAWDPEALLYMQGVYLKAIREAGDASKRFVYQAVASKAEKESWKIGSESSAYEHFTRLNPLLEKYARGGSRALDNIFYIIRQYKDLAPFECIVGDQHRFDFWVHDREIDKIFRMEGYFWLDLRTRNIYGCSLADRYNSYMIGLSMRMGIGHFGKFQKAYTDNGKPETSRFFNLVGNDLQAYGIQSKDIVELYRTKDNKYAIEGEDEGKIIETVDTPEVWHRYARPYNAKAKLIERFFGSFERILLDLGVPGHIRELKGTSEEKALSDRRLKNLIKENKLLTPEEFILKAIEGVGVYSNRRHSALGRTPMEELLYAVKNEGFKPVYMPEHELDFVLLKREERTVNRGRIWIEKKLYEGLNLECGLWDLADGTRVEVRYDPYDFEKAFAVKPGGEAITLRKVPESSMKDNELVTELMKWKKEMMEKVREHYKKLTAPVPGVIEYSSQKIVRSQKTEDR